MDQRIADRIPIRFAQIASQKGSSQLVGIIQGSGSLAMAVDAKKREQVDQVTNAYRRLAAKCVDLLSKLNSAESVHSRASAALAVKSFLSEFTSTFEFVAFPEALARDLRLAAGSNEANALLALAMSPYALGELDRKISWRTFVYVHSALQVKGYEKGNLQEELLEIVDKQAALAYRGNSFAAGKVARDIFGVMKRHRLI